MGDSVRDEEVNGEKPMLLKGYREELSRPTCNNTFQSLHCIAYLDEDISGVLPYLNCVLGGDSYIKEPPSVTFKTQGKLITVHARRIAVNALRDEVEAHHILEWLKEEINNAWENRATLIPKYDGKSKPKILEIYKLLPKTNCRKCGQPSCMMFASLAADGIKGYGDCPDLSGEGANGLKAYLGKFRFD
jgi:ArsR family metal-binding transcriptional regulator